MEELEYLKGWIMAAQPDSVSDILKKIDSILEGDPLSMPGITHINFSGAEDEIAKAFLIASNATKASSK